MKTFQRSYFPLTPDTFLVQWPMEIDKDILFDLVAFKEVLEATYPNSHCHGGYNELLVRMPEPISDFTQLTQELDTIYDDRNFSSHQRTKFYLPVCYDPVYGDDLHLVCETLGLEVQELVALHTQAVYTVYAIGFLPGFMYLGGLDPKLHFPRKEQPRTEVPKGSVGIGGMQTGIYPQESPGGWQLIGRCPVPIFDVHQQPPFFAKVGDEVQFYSVGKEEFELIQIQVKTGIYSLRKEGVL